MSTRFPIAEILGIAAVLLIGVIVLMLTDMLTVQIVPSSTVTPVSLMRGSGENVKVICWVIPDQVFDDGLFVRCNEGIGNLPAVAGYMFQGECYTPDSGLYVYLSGFVTNESKVFVYSATDGVTVFGRFTDDSNFTNWIALGPVTTCAKNTPTAVVTPQS